MIVEFKKVNKPLSYASDPLHLAMSGNMRAALYIYSTSFYWDCIKVTRNGDVVEFSSVYLPTVSVPYNQGNEKPTSPTWRRRQNARLGGELVSYREGIVNKLTANPDLRDAAYSDDFDDVRNTHCGWLARPTDKPMLHEMKGGSLK